MNKATELKNLDEEYFGRASLYHLSPPLMSYGSLHEHVIISSSAFLGTRETLIFAADGPNSVKPSSWSDLQGSQRNVYCHHEVLNDIGYEVDTI